MRKYMYAYNVSNENHYILPSYTNKACPVGVLIISKMFEGGRKKWSGKWSENWSGKWSENWSENWSEKWSEKWSVLGRYLVGTYGCSRWSVMFENVRECSRMVENHVRECSGMERAEIFFCFITL